MVVNDFLTIENNHSEWIWKNCWVIFLKNNSSYPVRNKTSILARQVSVWHHVGCFHFNENINKMKIRYFWKVFSSLLTVILFIYLSLSQNLLSLSFGLAESGVGEYILVCKQSCVLLLCCVTSIPVLLQFLLYSHSPTEDYINSLEIINETRISSTGIEFNYY